MTATTSTIEPTRARDLLAQNLTRVVKLPAETVEPLPFHGMSGYPYREDEGFPDDEEHRRWREEWQTREARPLIQPVAPGR